MTVALGPDWQDAFDGPALSFGLGRSAPASHGEALIFIRAFDRARTLFDAVFAESSTVLAVIAAAPGDEDGFEQLRLAGLEPRAVLQSWSGAPFWPMGSDPLAAWPHRALEIVGDTAARDLLLWNDIAREAGVQPTTPVYTRFVDPERRLMLAAHGDRRLDVAGDEVVLRGLAKAHEAWLYGRERLERAPSAFPGGGRLFSIITGSFEG